jgi:hypothetical protein
MYINGSCAVAAAKKVAPLIASKKVRYLRAHESDALTDPHYRRRITSPSGTKYKKC